MGIISDARNRTTRQDAREGLMSRTRARRLAYCVWLLTALALVITVYLAY